MLSFFLWFTETIGSMSSMEVNVDMLEQMDLMDMSDHEALDVFLNSGGEDNSVASPMLGIHTYNDISQSAINMFIHTRCYCSIVIYKWSPTDFHRHKPLLSNVWHPSLCLKNSLASLMPSADIYCLRQQNMLRWCLIASRKGFTIITNYIELHRKPNSLDYTGHIRTLDLLFYNQVHCMESDRDIHYISLEFHASLLTQFMLIWNHFGYALF